MEQPLFQKHLGSGQWILTIDIKHDTHKFNSYEIQNLIKTEVLGEDWPTILLEDLQRKLDGFEVDWGENSSSSDNQRSPSGFKNVIEEPILTLSRMNKRQRLSFWEKSFLYKESMQGKISISEIARKYRVWRNTENSILNDFRNPISCMFSMSGKSSRIIWGSEALNREIEKYCDAQIHPFISKDVSTYIKEKYGININKSVYSKIMRENLSMSYNKGKSCIRGIQKDRMDLLKCLFAIRIIPHLSEFEMLINIDESSFSRTTKLTHSWLKNEKAWKLGNIWSSSSTSLITAIISRGNVFAANTKGSVNSSRFLEFMAKLRTFIRGSCNIQEDRCLFILDNASTHRSAKVVEYWKQYSLSVSFIPPYMPELAPIEKYFSILKNSILRRTKEESINWQSAKGTNIIKEWVKETHETNIRKLWLTFTYELKEGIQILNKVI